MNEDSGRRSKRRVISSATPKSPPSPRRDPASRAYSFLALLTERDQGAIGQNGLDAEHMITGHAVLETVCAARVERDITPNRAYRLTRRVGSVIEPEGSRGLRDAKIDTPGSTTAIASSASRRRMRSSRFSPITTPPSTGSEPPERLVPLPRATKGTSCSWQARTAATTSSELDGRTTTRGRTR